LDNNSTEAPVTDASATAPTATEGAPVEAPQTETEAQTQVPVQAEAPAQTETEAQPEAPAQSATPSRQPSMAQIMEMDEFSSYISGADALQRGALLRGIVVRIDENTGEMLVDIGTKSEGIVARNEIGEGDEVQVGAEIEVVVLRPEDDEGHPVLSKRRADYERRWREIQQAKETGETLEGTVREQVKGGLIIDIGVPAFIPASHVDTRNRGDLGRFVGRTIPVRVIETDRKKNKVIASHRLPAEEERQKKEGETWGTLQKDKIIEGVVRRITDFGAFVDLGGVDGLLHVREMAWGRVEHPEHVVKKGQKIQVLILDIDEERKRVALGLKQLQGDPWKKAAKNFKVGQTLKGKVVRIAPSCAFMELEDGVEGIIPISEMSETRINKPEDVMNIGDEIEARIKQIQPNQRRITLSLRAAVVERERRETRTAIREVNERASGGGDDGGVRLGDLFGQELRAARDRGRERETKAAQRREARQRLVEEADEQDWDELNSDLDAALEPEVEEVEGAEAQSPEVGGAEGEGTAEAKGTEEQA
jgi:4-hydroxy-3-methylbut-2-enyl diphosphate reductase